MVNRSLAEHVTVNSTRMHALFANCSLTCRSEDAGGEMQAAVFDEFHYRYGRDDL
jgi:hypothetical protein